MPFWKLGDYFSEYVINFDYEFIVLRAADVLLWLLNVV
jgi:hypothetical protein